MKTHQNKKTVKCKNCGVFIAHEHVEQHGIQYEKDKSVKVDKLNEDFVPVVSIK